jgi:DNA-directed RNA polymerase subunit RPC12/RpoP
MIGKSAVCPSCSGMALLDIEQERIRCIDCGDTFRITGIGQTDREIVCENIG